MLERIFVIWSKRSMLPSSGLRGFAVLSSLSVSLTIPASKAQLRLLRYAPAVRKGNQETRHGLGSMG